MGTFWFPNKLLQYQKESSWDQTVCRLLYWTQMLLETHPMCYLIWGDIIWARVWLDQGRNILCKSISALVRNVLLHGNANHAKTNYDCRCVYCYRYGPTLSKRKHDHYDCSGTMLPLRCYLFYIFLFSVQMSILDFVIQTYQQTRCL